MQDSFIDPFTFAGNWITSTVYLDMFEMYVFLPQVEEIEREKDISVIFQRDGTTALSSKMLSTADSLTVGLGGMFAPKSPDLTEHMSKLFRCHSTFFRCHKIVHDFLFVLM